MLLSKRKLSSFLFVAVIIAALCTALHSAILEAAGEIASVLVVGNKRHPIYAVEKEEKEIALSFDATWGASRTPEILRILKEYDIKTTFFLTNIWLKEYPQYARQIVEEGHEVALHSASHPRMTDLPDEKIRAELLDNARMIEEVTGKKPVLFRPPFGAYNNTVLRIAEELEFIPVQWSVDSLDWKDLSSQDIIKRITTKAKPGAIVLFHNDGRNTPQALEPILQYLINEGYKIMPVSALIYQDRYYIDQNGIQKKETINP